MRQKMVVIGHEWNFGCRAECGEFSVVRIFDEDKVVGINRAGKLSFRAKEISELIPTVGRYSAQYKLGLAPGRFVPDQLKASFTDSRDDTRRCAFPVEARGYEDIRVDDNPCHSDFIHYQGAKISLKSRVVHRPNGELIEAMIGSGLQSAPPSAIDWSSSTCCADYSAEPEAHASLPQRGSASLAPNLRKSAGSAMSDLPVEERTRPGGCAAPEWRINEIPVGAAQRSAGTAWELSSPPGISLWPARRKLRAR
jgi:hypothetical protein